jgi:hypothetical protein
MKKRYEVGDILEFERTFFEFDMPIIREIVEVLETSDGTVVGYRWKWVNGADQIHDSRKSVDPLFESPQWKKIN